MNGVEKHDTLSRRTVESFENKMNERLPCGVQCVHWAQLRPTYRNLVPTSNEKYKIREVQQSTVLLLRGLAAPFICPKNLSSTACSQPSQQKTISRHCLCISPDFPSLNFDACEFSHKFEVNFRVEAYNKVEFTAGL